MREDQRQRLVAIQEKLADEALIEMDPDNWPGAGVPREEWSAKVRGDRNWSMKNANASVALLVNLKRLVDDAPAGPAPEDEAEAERARIAAAESAAQALMERVGKKNGRRDRTQDAT